jgi:hypothetical protein
MSKTKSKQAAKRTTTGAARKGSSSRKLRIGDRVRIIDIPSGFKDPNYDLKDAEHREMRTAELFRFCLGRDFAIEEFDQYGNAELSVDKDRSVRKKFGLNTIWMEPEYLERIQSGKSKVLGKRKAN